MAARLILDTCQGMVSSGYVLDHRPRQVSRLLLDKTASQAEQLAGLLLRLCADAQKIAVRAACMAARGGLEESPEELALPLRRAMVRDHAWYLLLNLPQVCGLPQATQQLKALLHWQEGPDLARALEALLQQHLLGMPAAQWLELSPPDFWNWYREAPGAGATLLACMSAQPQAEGLELTALTEDPTPSETPPDLGIGDELGENTVAALLPSLARLDAPMLLAWVREFAGPLAQGQALRWQNLPVQTGALVRQWDHAHVRLWCQSRGAGAGARVLARLVELAQLGQQRLAPDMPLVRAWTLAPGHGLAAVETARGLLLHEVQLAAGLIRAYKIISPTDWNLSAGGALSRALRGTPVERRVLMQIIQSFDPCLELELEFVHA